MDAVIFKIGLFVVLFMIGWAVGRSIEAKHFKALDAQEQRLAYIRTDNSRFKSSDQTGQLISSNVVISHDYFKYVIATIQSLFGGRLTSYETVVERARREAIVRLKLEAEKNGADHILGLRISTTDLGMLGMTEVFAYGTAIRSANPVV